MPRKRDHSAERLRKHAEMESNPLARALGIVNEAALLGPAYDAARKLEEANWDDPTGRALAAHRALQVDELDGPLNKSFRDFGLDPRNPFHWRKLLAYFADAHFGPKGHRRGPDKIWVDDRLCQLLSDFDQVKTRRMLVPGSTISDLEACTWLKSHPTLGKKYSGYSPATLLRNLQRARSPAKNGLLAELVAAVAEPFLVELRAAAKLGQVGWGSQGEQRILSMVLPAVIKVLSSRWRDGFDKQSSRVQSSFAPPVNDPKLIRSRRRAGLGY